MAGKVYYHVRNSASARIIFLTDVVKLFHICRADALQTSRPFKKYLSLERQRDNNKNQRSNGNIFYIRKSIRSS